MKKFLVLVMMVSILKATTVYQTDFENCTDSIPPGWIMYNLNGGHAFAAVHYSSGANSGSWFIRYNSRYESRMGDDWILSDTFTLVGNVVDTLMFYEMTNSSRYTEKLRVYLVMGNRPDDTVKLLWRDDTITNTSYELQEVVFKAPATGTYRLGFYSNSDPDGRAIRVDDVYVGTDRTPSSPDNNIAIDAVYPYLTDWVADRKVDTIGTFTVVVKDYGNHDFNNTRIRYRIDSAGTSIVPETEIAHDNIRHGQTYVYTFNFNPSIYHMAEYDIYVYHDKYGDPNNKYRKDDTFHMHFIVQGHQGKDSYGWVFRDSESLLGDPGVSWIELDNDGNAEDLGLDDEGSVTRNLAHSIKFYGNDYNQIIIDPNGIISFDQDPTGNNYENDSIPSSNASIAIMPFWDDLDPSSGGKVYYRTRSDTLTIVEWYQVRRYNSDSTLTFEVQIESNQASNGIYDNITFLYRDMQYDYYNMDATIGIQDRSQGYYMYYTYDEKPYTPDWNSGVFAIKFYAPEALGVKGGIAYDRLNGIRTVFALQNAISIAKYNPFSCKVWNITGQLLPVSGTFENGRYIIDFSQIKRGIYYILLSNENGQKERLRVVNTK